MEASGAQVPVASSRMKYLHFSIIVVVTIAITNSGILIYDKVQKNETPMGEGPENGGQNPASLSPNGTNGSVTLGPTTTKLAISMTISDVNGISDFFETIPTTSAEQETTETETMSSHVTVPLTNDDKFSTTVQTSRESTTFEDMSTCQQTLFNITIIADYPPDCSGFEIAVGQNATHTIYPDGSLTKTALANCISSFDGRWTVIQRRFDGSVNFYRNWVDYKEGFGDESGEYWLGNDAIHQLTSQFNYKLKVVLKDWDNVTAYEMFNTFRITDETNRYRLTIGDYHGDAGDSLTQHNCEMFSTQDRDNDKFTGSCAADHTGAWWYKSCYQSNLNGRYFHKAGTFHTGVITWRAFRSLLSLKETTMMIQKI